MNTSVCAVILATGSGSRMKLDITKQKILLGKESVLHRTVRIFQGCESIDSIIVVCRADEIDFAKEETSKFSKVREIVVGGETRFESARLGFLAIPENSDYVAIHDAARCFVSSDMISAVVLDAKKYGAATASAEVTDKVKSVDADNRISATVDRDTLVLVQTPQIFRTDLYKKAVEAYDGRINVTDDNMLVELIGVKPYCTDTGKRNIKITTVEDLNFANYLLNGE